MNTAPRLTLKGVKTFRGREGLGMNATLLFDGVAVAEVLDEGNGGSTRYYWRDGHHTTPLSEMVRKYVASLTDIPERDRDLDFVVACIADDLENRRRIKRLAKTNILFTLPSDKEGEFHQVKHGGRPEEARAAMLKVHPDAKFIEE